MLDHRNKNQGEEFKRIDGERKSPQSFEKVHSFEGLFSEDPERGWKEVD